MKKLLCVMLVSGIILTGCGKQAENVSSVVEEVSTQVQDVESVVENESESSEVASEDTSEAEVKSETETASEEVIEEAVLEDGVYLVDFNTDSGMFHANEACNGKGSLTVSNGKMTLHVSLTSKNILNLYAGLAEEAQKEGAELLEPTTDQVTYDDGTEEEVYGFDIPVPYIDREFDVALIGKKGKWYDHKVSVSNPELLED